MVKVLLNTFLLFSLLLAIYPDDTIWVSNNLGDDANPGTPDSPKATIQAGINALETGGVVIVDNRSGNVYDETVSHNTTNTYYKREINWWYPDSGYIQVRRSSGYALNVNSSQANMVFNHMTFYSPDNYAVYYIYGLISFHSCSLYTDNSSYDGFYYAGNSGYSVFDNCYISGGRYAGYRSYSAFFHNSQLRSGNNVFNNVYGSFFDGCDISIPAGYQFIIGYFGGITNCYILGGGFINLNNGGRIYNSVINVQYINSQYYFTSVGNVFRNTVTNSYVNRRKFIFVNSTFFPSSLPIKLSYGTVVIFVNCIFTSDVIDFNANYPSYVRFYNCSFMPGSNIADYEPSDVYDWDTINCIIRDPELDSIDWFPQDSLCQIWGVPSVWVEIPGGDTMFIEAPTKDINYECLAVNDSQWTLGAKSWTHGNNCSGGYNGDLPEISGYDHLVIQMEKYFSSKHGSGSWEGGGGASDSVYVKGGIVDTVWYVDTLGKGGGGASDSVKCYGGYIDSVGVCDSCRSANCIKRYYPKGVKIRQ